MLISDFRHSRESFWLIKYITKACPRYAEPGSISAGTGTRQVDQFNVLCWLRYSRGVGSLSSAKRWLKFERSA
jgi:hypothetical protein